MRKHKSISAAPARTVDEQNLQQMDPNKPPTGSPWNPDEKSGMNQQPPSYQDCIAGNCPPPGGHYPNLSGYPQGQPYGAPYVPPYPKPYEDQMQGPYGSQPPAVTVQPPVYVISGPLAQPYPDYLCYSIFTLLCCCFPLGIAALVYSVNTREANNLGSRPLAERYSRLARILNNTALGIGIAFIIMYLIIITI